VSVADTGIGMDEATQKRIFEPFFTTKEVGRGTGLGLASAYGIVTNHDGAIDFISQLGEGTTFYIHLPVCEERAVEAHPSKRTRRKGSGTILLVDDEAVVIEVNRPMLNELGYHVLTAQNGAQALEIFKKKHAGIDMVILDLIMPDMDGCQVFNQMRKIKPEIKVLLFSGHNLNEAAGQIIESGAAGFIQKPFNLDQLAEKVEQLLRKSGRARKEKK
jgi:CheY-like chemotaxis protein